MTDLDENIAFTKYEAARELCDANCIAYISGSELADKASLADLIKRITTVVQNHSEPVAAAVLGAYEVPGLKISRVVDIYIDESCASELTGKNPAQRYSWSKVKRRAVKNLIACACANHGQPRLGEYARYL